MSIAFITGANKGLGLETARQLGRDHSMTVVLGCRDQARGFEARQLLQSEGLDAHCVTIDVTDETSIEKAAQHVREQFGGLDVLINNAGVMLEHDARVVGVTTATWRQTFDVNLFGAVAITNAFLPLLRDASAPRVVNVSAILGSLGEISKPQMKSWIRASYSASKAALNAYTIALAQELSGTPIKVNAAHPGWAKTDMGGPQAPMTPALGVRTVVQLATLPDDGPSGGFFHAGKTVAW
jgi:NAD(P)-dependent dehydrogenase (short-subunit alcohol dehydrogenase family)